MNDLSVYLYDRCYSLTVGKSPKAEKYESVTIYLIQVQVADLPLTELTDLEERTLTVWGKEAIIGLEMGSVGLTTDVTAIHHNEAESLTANVVGPAVLETLNVVNPAVLVTPSLV